MNKNFNRWKNWLEADWQKNKLAEFKKKKVENNSPLCQGIAHDPCDPCAMGSKSSKSTYLKG